MNYFAFGPISVGVASLLLGTAISAAELDWSLESAIGHTDNATRVANNEISDDIGSIGGTIDLNREGSRIDARLRGAGSFRTYLDDTYDDEFLGSGAAEFRLGLVGDALIWAIDDTFGQVLSDTFEPSTPDNRENLNVFSTGPDLHLQVGRTTELLVQGRYEDASYQSSDNADTQRVTGDIALIRRPSASVAWSLHASTSHVEYDTAGDTDYDNHEIFVRLESTGAHQTLTADLGAGFLDGGNQKDQAMVMRVDWTRHLTPSWHMELGAISEYRNADDQFVSGVAGGSDLGGTQDVLLSGQAMRNDSAALSLHFTRPRTTLRLLGDIGKESYPDTDGLDRDRWSLGVEASRLLTARLRATIEARHEDRSNDNSVDDDKTSMFGARLDWRVGKALYIGLQGRHEDRSGETDFGYTETIYGASISYRPNPE
jgi:hypothetical protein